jgi:hypothetical protein
LAWERALIAEEERARNLRRPGPFLPFFFFFF